MGVLEILIVILVLFWLLGYGGPFVFASLPNLGGLVHLLLVIAVIVLIVRLIRGRGI